MTRRTLWISLSLSLLAACQRPAPNAAVVDTTLVSGATPGDSAAPVTMPHGTAPADPLIGALDLPGTPAPVVAHPDSAVWEAFQTVPLVPGQVALLMSGPGTPDVNHVLVGGMVAERIGSGAKSIPTDPSSAGSPYWYLLPDVPGRAVVDLAVKMDVGNPAGRYALTAPLRNPSEDRAVPGHMSGVAGLTLLGPGGQCTGAMDYRPSSGELVIGSRDSLLLGDFAFTVYRDRSSTMGDICASAPKAGVAPASGWTTVYGRWVMPKSTLLTGTTARRLALLREAEAAARTMSDTVTGVAADAPRPAKPSTRRH